MQAPTALRRRTMAPAFARSRRRRGIVQALCRSLERFQQPTLCRSLGMFRFLAQAAIGSPMHTARLHAKRFRRGRPQTRSDLLRSACGPHPRILLLARIGQAKAAPACEAPVCPVKLCNPPATKASFTRARAIEPRSLWPSGWGFFVWQIFRRRQRDTDGKG